MLKTQTKVQLSDTPSGQTPPVEHAVVCSFVDQNTNIKSSAVTLLLSRRYLTDTQTCVHSLTCSDRQTLVLLSIQARQTPLVKHAVVRLHFYVNNMQRCNYIFTYIVRSGAPTFSRK